MILRGSQTRNHWDQRKGSLQADGEEVEDTSENSDGGNRQVDNPENV